MTHTVAFAGCPNVGKSTVFNALTGLRQHTGNWTGKTVELARGRWTLEGETWEAVDTAWWEAPFADALDPAA